MNNNTQIAENAKLASKTSKSDKDLYRNSGYDPAGKSLETIAQDLQLPTIYEAPIEFSGFRNTHVKALHLNDGTLFDVVSEKWNILQPIRVVEMFMEFCAINNLTVDKVGVLDSYKSKDYEDNRIDAKQTYTIYVSAFLGDNYSVSSDDQVSGRVIFKSPYIGGQGYSCGVMSLRKVCTNGLYLPVNLKRKTVNHLGSQVSKEDQLTKLLERSQSLWEEDKKVNNLFSDVECTELEAVMTLVKTFSIIPEHKQIAKQALIELKMGKSIDAVEAIYFSSLWDKEAKIVKECLQMFKQGLFTGSEKYGTKSTMWGLLNAVTEYINWGTKQYGSKSLGSLMGGAKAHQMLKFRRTLQDVVSVKVSC